MQNKYEVINPDDDKYKVTDKEIKDNKKYNNKRDKKGKSKKKKVIISIIVIIAILIGSCVGFIYFYLSKINKGDVQLDTNPEMESTETLNFNGQKDADTSIKKNYDDNTIWYNENIYNILLVGVDLGDYEKVTFKGQYLPRSDSMILISINKINNKINMVSLSRAAYVAIPGHGNKRLNTAYAFGGADLLIKTVEKNYKIYINKYITVNFEGFESIIDSIGGVDISMTKQEAKAVLGKSKADTYNLSGKNALAYSRLRSIDSDRARTGRQRAVLNAIAYKAKAMSASQMMSTCKTLFPLVWTDFSNSEIISQATKAPSYLSMSIVEDVIPHKSTSLTMKDGKEVLILDWSDTRSYIHKLLYPDLEPQNYDEVVANEK